MYFGDLNHRFYDDISGTYDAHLRDLRILSHGLSMLISRTFDAVLRVFDVQIVHLEVKISLEISSVEYMIEVSSHRR